ncbi:MAG: ABC transporter ATP-binding protein [Paracoccaceae bacterium]
MVRLEHVTAGYRRDGQFRPVLLDQSLMLSPGRALAVLGRTGAGKSTFLRIVAGLHRVERGQVEVTEKTSWTMGPQGPFHEHQTGAQNLRFLARLYGVNPEELTAFVSDFAQIDRHLHQPYSTYTPGLRARLSFGAAMGLRLNLYLLDDPMTGSDASFRRRSRLLFQQRLQTAGALIATHDMRYAREFCDAGLVLENGQVHMFDELEDAIALYQSLHAEAA